MLVCRPTAERNQHWDGIVSVPLTQVGAGLYRLDGVPLGIESAAFGDIIEAEPGEEGRLRFVCVALLSLAFHLLGSTCTFSAAASGKIILGYAAPGARALPFWMAQELGLFAKYGVDVEPVFRDHPDHVNTAG